MSNFIKKILITFTFISLLGFITIFSILWSYSNKLPDYKFLKNYKPPVSSKVYSGNGVLISDFSTCGICAAGVFSRGEYGNTCR